MGGGGNKIVSVIKNHCYCTKNKPISLLSCGRCQMLWMLIISISNGHLLGLSYLQFLLLISYSITPSNSFNQAISSMVASLFIKLYLPQDIHFTHFQCPIYGYLKPGYPPSIPQTPALSRTAHPYKFIQVWGHQVWKPLMPQLLFSVPSAAYTVIQRR